MDDDELPIPPDHEITESLMDAASVVTASIPLISTLVSALERSVHRAWREQERAYLQSVIQRLAERLNQHDERLDQLSTERINAFGAAVASTYDLARATADSHKRLVLRNEAVNSAMPSAPGVALREIYIAMTARLTGLHLRIFGFLTKPELFGAPVANWGDLEQFRGDGPWETHTWDIIRQYVPSAPDNETIQHCFTDLVNQDVVTYPGGGSLPGITFPRTTNFGWGFYDFIIDEDAAHEGLVRP